MSEPETKQREAPPGAEGPSEAPAAFKVIDRRRFAPDGTERPAEEGVESKEAPARPTLDPASESAAEGSVAAAGSGSGPTESPGARVGADFVMSGSERRRAEPSPEPTISTLFLSLSTQALMHLGEIPDLATGRPDRDLPAARSIIDLLAVLEHKTMGNLDTAEAALLERILYDLRMRFVELSRS